MPLAPEDVQQLMEAFKPVLEAMVDAKLNEGTGDPTLEPPPDDPLADPLAGPPSPDALSPPAPPSPLSDDDKNYAMGMYRKMRKYMKEDGTFDDDAAKQYAATMDDDDKEIYSRYAKECGDDDDKELYEKSFGGEKIPDVAGEMKTGNPSVERYRKERDDWATKYRKLESSHRSMATKYAKAQQELAAAQEELTDVREKERYSKRRAGLVELQSAGFIFDLEDELESVVKPMTDDQFERHIGEGGTIKTRYQKAPFGNVDFGAGGEPHPSVQKSKTEKYSKAAKDLCLQYSKQGIQVEYGKVLNMMVDGDGQIDEEKLGIKPQVNGRRLVAVR